VVKKAYITGMDNYGYTHLDNGELDNLPVIKGTYYELKSLQERHKEVLRLLAMGVSKKDIAAKLGITVATIRMTANSVLGQEYLKYIRGEREEETMDIQKSIDELAAPAVDVIRQAIAGKMELELTDPESGKLKTVEIPVKNEQRIKASQDILSRHSEGYSPRQRGTVEHTGNVSHDLSQLISNVKNRAKQLNGNNIQEAEIVEPEQIESAEDSSNE